MGADTVVADGRASQARLDRLYGYCLHQTRIACDGNTETRDDDHHRHSRPSRGQRHGGKQDDRGNTDSDDQPLATPAEQGVADGAPAKPRYGACRLRNAETESGQLLAAARGLADEQCQKSEKVPLPEVIEQVGQDEAPVVPVAEEFSQTGERLRSRGGLRRGSHRKRDTCYTKHNGQRRDNAARHREIPPTHRARDEAGEFLEAAFEGTLDDEAPRPGSYDVLAQHMLAMACSQSFEADNMYSEITAAAPYVNLPRVIFNDVLAFIDHGGYALRTYQQWRRLKNIENQTYKIASQKVARRVRMNIGTIVESQMLQVRIGRQTILGKVEENFVLGLSPGDTFMFGGHVLRFQGIRNMTVATTLATGSEPKIPSYQGGRLPLSTHLADRVRSILANPQTWPKLPNQVRDWLGIQSQLSVMPKSDGLLVETFERSGKAFLVAYCFEGRNAHQTLGILLTKRMERAGLGPIGFVGTDYNIAIWSIYPVTDINELFDEDMLGDDLEEWLADSSLLRRTFREVATISGLIERNHPGTSKTGRQMTVSSDLIYDTLRRYDPNHIMLRVTRSDAARGLTDIKRLAEMLKRVKGKIVHKELSRASPLSVPILLEIGRETVGGSHTDMLLGEAESVLLSEAFATENIS